MLLAGDFTNMRRGELSIWTSATSSFWDKAQKIRYRQTDLAWLASMCKSKKHMMRQYRSEDGLARKFNFLMSPHMNH